MRADDGTGPDTAEKSPDPGPERDPVDDRLPLGWRLSAAFAWRGLVCLAGLVVLGYLIAYLAVVVIPVAVALLLAALLHPVVTRLVRWGLPRAVAVALAVIGGLVIIGGVLGAVINALLTGLPGLQGRLGDSIQQINGWLAAGPLRLSPHTLQDLVNRAITMARAHQTGLLSGALSTLAEGLTAIALAIFTLIFFLYEGAAIWHFVVRAAPARERARIETAGHAGFSALTYYVRATILVAAGDALGIGIGLLVLGVPLALPLAALVFLGAFVPIAGTVLAGAVAVLVTLVTNGLGAALIMLVVVVVVMQLEGNVLQPLLLGHTLHLHPLAIVLAITVGAVAAGVPGALFAVPLLTVLVSGTRRLQGRAPESMSQQPAGPRRVARWFIRLVRGGRCRSRRGDNGSGRIGRRSDTR